MFEIGIKCTRTQITCGKDTPEGNKRVGGRIFLGENSKQCRVTL